MKTKAEAKVPNKSASAPVPEKQPERLEQQSGPLTIARARTAALPHATATPRPRAADVMRATEQRPDGMGRARLMQSMQGWYFRRRFEQE